MARDYIREMGAAEDEPKSPIGKLLFALLLLILLGAAGIAGGVLLAKQEQVDKLAQSMGLTDDQLALVNRTRDEVWKLTQGFDGRYRLNKLIWSAGNLFSLNQTQVALADLPLVDDEPDQSGFVEPEPAPEPGIPDTPPAESESAPSEPTAPKAALETETAALPAPETPDPTSVDRDAEPTPEPVSEPVSEPPTADPAPEPSPPPTELSPPDPQADPETAALTPAPPLEPPARVETTPQPPTAPTEEELLQQADLDYKQGLSYYQGVGREQSDQEAAKFFGRAALGGHAAAQYTLGLMHYLGRGLDQNFDKAVEWFGRAAEKNHAAAQYNLGIMYYYGQGVEKDDRAAFKWINAAAGNGDKKAIVARDALIKALPEDVTAPDDGATSILGAQPTG